MDPAARPIESILAAVSSLAERWPERSRGRRPAGSVGYGGLTHAGVQHIAAGVGGRAVAHRASRL